MCGHPHLEGLVQEHGGLDAAALRARGLSPAGILDFSVNINPFGASPGALHALRCFSPQDYPERRAETLTLALARLNGVETGQILAGNGTAELIWLAAFAWMRSARVAVLTPSFGEYTRAARAAGAELHVFPAEAPLFRWDLGEVCARIRSLRPAATFLCNPNNPTGTYLGEDEVRALADACGDGLLLLDEAYRSFITLRPFGLPLESPPPNLITLRSMTKDFALAGLRLGYVLGDAERIAELASVQPPWSVNGAAQAAGLAAAADLDHLRRTLSETRRAALDLRDDLTEAGARILPSETPYCLVDVSPLRGGQVLDALLRRGIQVRDCASFGLEQFVRIGTRRPEENARLVDAWREIFTRRD